MSRNPGCVSGFAADELVQINGIEQLGCLIIITVQDDQLEGIVEVRQYVFDQRYETGFEDQDLSFDLVQYVSQFACCASRRAMCRHIRRLGDGEVCDRVFRAIRRQDRNLRALAEFQVE